MKNVVFVNGFGNGRSSTEKVANALGSYYDGVEAFRFSDLTTSPDEIRKASAKADLITHSAGALALKLDSMDRVNSALLLGPPLSQRVSRLLYKTVVKTARMNTPGIGIHTFEDFVEANRYSQSSLGELIANPIDNFGRLSEIAKTDSVELASNVTGEGIPATLVWTTGDAYFRPTQSTLEIARANGITTISDLEGEHDEIVLRTAQFLDSVFTAQERI